MFSTSYVSMGNPFRTHNVLKSGRKYKKEGEREGEREKKVRLHLISQQQQQHHQQQELLNDES